MKKEMKATIVLGLVILLIVPCVTMNVSAAKTVPQIQADAEAQLGMKLKLCVQINITNGYDLLFMKDDNPVDLRNHHYFEVYYDDTQLVPPVTERFLENSSYVVGPIDIIHVNPLVTGQAISLTGTITMISGYITFIMPRSYTTNAVFAKVTAKGIFFVLHGQMIHIWDLSSEWHSWMYVRESWDHWRTYAPDHSSGQVDAVGIYYSNPMQPWRVWAGVKQWSDSIPHSDHWGGYGPAQ